MDAWTDGSNKMVNDVQTPGVSGKDRSRRSRYFIIFRDGVNEQLSIIDCVVTESDYGPRIHS